jgi:hypothetical protein
MKEKTMSEKKEHVIGDDVWNRVVQIVQEGMLMGVDVSDMMRQIRVNVNDDGSIHLTQGYIEMVKGHHQAMLLQAEALQAAQAPAEVPS